jgi:hypothetical protein
MEYDGSDNDLDLFMRESPELDEFVLEVAEQGADRWATRSRWRTGYNATHVSAYVEASETGEKQGVVYADGYYAEYRERGTRWNLPEHVMKDFIQDVDG